MSKRRSSKSKTLEEQRVVIHFDLDAFYVACERELNESLRGVPLAVSQYNPYGKLVEISSHQVDRRLVVRPGHVCCDNGNGSLIAVSYEARAAGVRRNDRGMKALSKCPDLRIVQVPTKHGKADLTMYRSASVRVMATLSRCLRDECAKATTDSIQVEIASIDEVYVDVTNACHVMARQLKNTESGVKMKYRWKDVVDQASRCTTIGGVETLSDAAEAANALNKDDLRRGSHLQVLDSSKDSVDIGSGEWWHRKVDDWTNIEIQLALGAFLAAKARNAVLKSFSGGVFTLSAGVSNNKSLAKLASGLKKPNRQTLINRMDTNGALEKLFHPLPLGRIRGLGGKFGDNIGSRLGISTVGQLASVPLASLVSALSGDDATAKFLYDISRGICHDPVTERTKVKSIESSKTFRGKLAIACTDRDSCRKWTSKLCGELTERVKADQLAHSRFPSLLVVSVRTSEQQKHSSKSRRAPKNLEEYSEVALQLVWELLDVANSRIQPSSSSRSKDASSTSISIVSMAITATSFVEVAAGPSSILAAFKRTPQGQQAAVSYVTRKEQQRCGTGALGEKTSSKLPLANVRKEKEAFSNSSSQSTTGLERQTKKRKTLHQFLTRPSTGTRTHRSLDSNEVAAAVMLPGMDEIDPAVLNEIPESVRLSLMKDLESQNRQRKKHTIASFFGSMP